MSYSHLVVGRKISERLSLVKLSVNAGLEQRKLLKTHSSYLALGHDMTSVEANYQSLFSR
ncbi:hypothetical protein [Thalassotalea ganghwensis]